MSCSTTCRSSSAHQCVTVCVCERVKESSASSTITGDINAIHLPFFQKIFPHVACYWWRWRALSDTSFPRRWIGLRSGDCEGRCIWFILFSRSSNHTATPQFCLDFVLHLVYSGLSSSSPFASSSVSSRTACSPRAISTRLRAPPPPLAVTEPT